MFEAVQSLFPLPTPRLKCNRSGYMGQDIRLSYVGSDAMGDAEWLFGECLITCQRSWFIAEGVLPIPQTPDDAASETSAVLPVSQVAGSASDSDDRSSAITMVNTFDGIHATI